MTIAAALRDAAQQLAAVSDTPRLDAELLMSEALGVARSELLLRRMRDPAPAAFAALLTRRLAHEPVAYIRGRQEFRGLEFAVTSAVLIPRADSETVVEAALAAKPDARRVLDLGVGSGALLLAVLAELSEAVGAGIDASQAAVQVAAGNAERLGIGDRAEMRVLDWTQEGWSAGLGHFDLILANPPYVEDDAELAPEVRGHEPEFALFAGRDGLDAYRAILPQLPNLLADNGVAVVEIGASQAEAVTALATAAGLDAVLHRDLAGRPRALTLKNSLGKTGDPH